MDKYMNVALDEVKKYLNKGLGGPFGACIIDSTGKIIAVAHNEVIKKINITEDIPILKFTYKELYDYYVEKVMKSYEYYSRYY